MVHSVRDNHEWCEQSPCMHPHIIFLNPLYTYTHIDIIIRVSVLTMTYMLGKGWW